MVKGSNYVFPGGSIPLGQGASGSMAINDKKEVVGIYWGGVLSSGSTYPMVSLFDNGSFNAIDDFYSYLKYIKA